MKIEIADYCIRCGICEDLYPDLFKRNYKDHCIDIAKAAKMTPEELEGKVIIGEMSRCEKPDQKITLKMRGNFSC